MINTKVIIFYDFETGSVDGDLTQPLELAAVAICPRKLEIIEDSLFHSMIKPLPDKKREKLGLSPITKEALDKNKIKLEELQSWPTEDIVCQNFAEYTYNWNIKKDSWNAVISAGFNIDEFDRKIINRWCKTYKYWDDKNNRQKLFNPIQSLDLKNLLWYINENNPEIEFNNMDAVRDWLGIPKEGAHRADKDVMDGAQVLCRCMKFIRHWASKTTFKW